MLSRIKNLPLFLKVSLVSLLIIALTVMTGVSVRAQHQTRADKQKIAQMEKKVTEKTEEARKAAQEAKAKADEAAAKAEEAKKAADDAAKAEVARKAAEEAARKAKEAAARAEAARKAAEAARYRIVVNKSKFSLILMENGNIIRQYIVAIGKPGHETPEGKFIVQNKMINPWFYGNSAIGTQYVGGDPNNPLGVRWMGLNVGRAPNEYGIHGTSQPNAIGTKDSSGCVRLSNENVIELFNIVPTGTAVWIGNDAQLASWGIPI